MIDGAFLWHFYILRNNRYLVKHMTWGNYFSFSHFLEAFAITLHYFHSFLFFDVFHGGDSLVLAFSKPRKWSGMHCQNSILENIYITYSFSILKFVWKVFGHWRIMNGCFSLAFLTPVTLAVIAQRGCQSNFSQLQSWNPLMRLLSLPMSLSMIYRKHNDMQRSPQKMS